MMGSNGIYPLADDDEKFLTSFSQKSKATSQSDLLTHNDNNTETYLQLENGKQDRKWITTKRQDSSMNKQSSAITTTMEQMGVIMAHGGKSKIKKDVLTAANEVGNMMLQQLSEQLQSVLNETFHRRVSSRIDDDSYSNNTNLPSEAKSPVANVTLRSQNTTLLPNSFRSSSSTSDNVDTLRLSLRGKRRMSSLSVKEGIPGSFRQQEDDIYYRQTKKITTKVQNVATPTSPSQRDGLKSPLRPRVIAPQGKALPTDVTNILMTWFLSHMDSPYPNAEEKVQLMVKTGLNHTQLRNWLTNQRKRHWKPVVTGGRQPRSQLELVLATANTGSSQIQ